MIKMELNKSLKGIYSFDEMKEIFIGKIGSKERDTYEKKVRLSVQKKLSRP